MNNQKIKADAGKNRLSLLPMEFIKAVGWIMTYGASKYGEGETWKQVETKRYRDALLRHIVEYIDNPESVDEESGMSHLWHAATNIAFLIEKDKWEKEERKCATGGKKNAKPATS